ncbi:MAG: peptidase T [Saprospiraceae bacterium]|nr:peptidase T [Saprospiraceae bacterium]MBK9221865.1 peptidase T [Saprospiraceae bacterium]MBK9728194.1 peptidase T [Saprospiraceae bacterium]
MNYTDFKTTAERFIRYAMIDTQADPSSETVPSSMKQLNLAKLLFEELKQANIEDVELDAYGYIYASLPSNSTRNIPTICFCAHMDTAPDCSGTNVKPILHQNYQMQEIRLPDDSSILISPEEFKELSKKQGETIITASGLTLLGADDKAGITAIMEAAIYLKNHPEIAHGKIRILFTPDEEIGRGVNHVDMKKLGADFGYTMDSGELGAFEDETFSADAVHIEITGVSTHPGYAKGKMENAIKIAAEIIANIPKDHLIPEVTEGREGFIHPVKVVSELEKSSLYFIIRDFETSKLMDHENYLEKIVKQVMLNYPNSKYTFTVSEQYRNMKEILNNHPEVVEYVEQAIVEANIKPIKGLIRGGTDGSRLSFMGLPCPNIFAGEHGIHSKKEWVSEQDMQRAAEVIVRICQICERNA